VEKADEKTEENLSKTCRERVPGPDIARIASPLAFYAIYLMYLVFFDTDPFLVKWLEGSFALFLALVMCNIIRHRLLPPDEKPNT
jgi:hypothetical protein